MRVKNPLTFLYQHPNFGTGATEASLNDSPTDESILHLEIKAPDGRAGVANLEFQDNGNVVVRVALGSNSPIHVKVVDSSGTTIFEQ